MREQGIDAVLSTSSPQTSALVARRLASEFQVPWVADFRDLWVQYQRYPYGGLRRSIERRLERWTLSEANALTTVTAPLAEKWRELHPGKPIYVIPNSFDPELLPTAHRDDDGVLRITLTGKVIKGSQDPSILFQAISELIAENRIRRDDVSVRFWGNHSEWLRPLIERFDVADVVQLNAPVPRSEALQHQMDSDLLLVLTWTNPAEKGVLTGKLPEYLGTHIPILAIGPYPDAVTEVLTNTRAGEHYTEVDPLKDYLEDCCSLLKSGARVPYHGVESEVEQYSAKTMTERFTTIIENAQEMQQRS
jgi:glycosyltransferase involved in cell wall biosynthesis